jgi:hypothetical protein
MLLMVVLPERVDGLHCNCCRVVCTLHYLSTQVVYLVVALHLHQL